MSAAAKNKLVFFKPSAYSVRGWVSVLAAVVTLLAYFLDFSSTTIFLICYMYHHFENLCSIPRALALTNTRSLLDKPNVYAVNETESTHTIPTMKNLITVSSILK